jgi:hypothetical protein
VSPKRIIIVGTMAIVITIGVFRNETNVNAYVSIISLDKSDVSQTKKTNLTIPHKQRFATGDFLQSLGASSEEEVYDALYNGKSLADIAKSNHKDVQPLIDLQVTELTAQLDQRLAAGSLSPEDYQAQKAELPDLISKSVYGKMGT